MEKEIVLRIIGELYLNNYVLSRRDEVQREEIAQLKTLVEQLDGRTNRP